MKSKSDVCTFGLSIGLTLDKRNFLNNLKPTIYNYLKKTKQKYNKSNLDKNMLQLPDVKLMPKFEAFCICDNVISSIANLVYELPHELQGDLRLRILENKEILGKSQIWVET